MVTYHFLLYLFCHQTPLQFSIIHSLYYYIRILPVYDVLQDVEAANEKLDLVTVDMERINRVHQEIGKTFLKRDLPLSELQEENVIEQEL